MKATELAAVMRGIAPAIREYVSRGLSDLSARVAELETRRAPVGDRGPQGERGERGEKGLDGLHGKDGAAGRDGTIDAIKPVLELDGRTVTWRYKADDTPVPDWSVTFDNLIYREVFTQGTTYVRGDAVTWGGHIYVAKQTTTMKPENSPQGSKFWTLAVKAGRDGKTGIAGKDGAPGPQGTPGRDGKTY